MSSSSEAILCTGNICIVESQDSTALPALDIMERLRSFAGDLRETVQIAVFPQQETKENAMRRLFGAWVETGDEDEVLAEIYRRRLFSSSRPIDEE